MPPIKTSAKAEGARTLRGPLLLVAFGLSVLAFLVAIDRPEWFHADPAIGVAAAMPQATGG